MKAYETITEHDIERWNAAAEIRHGHKNIHILSQVNAENIGNLQIESGASSNQMLVWNNASLIYQPKTLTEVRQLLNLKGTNSDMNTLAGTLGPEDAGLWFFNTTHNAPYQWNGTEFK